MNPLSPNAKVGRAHGPLSSQHAMVGTCRRFGRRRGGEAIDGWPIHGQLPNVEVGATFRNRVELPDSGVHRHRLDGISWPAGGGPAESIVLSGGLLG
jgi:hypothetical protein